MHSTAIASHSAGRLSCFGAGIRIGLASTAQSSHWGKRHAGQRQVSPARGPHSARLVQHRRRSAAAAAAAASPRHRQADRPRRPRAALPDGADHARRSRPSARSRFRSRCARSTSCGGRRRSSAPAGSRQLLDTPARIFYKYEGVSPPGSHKPNTAVAAGLLQPRGRRQEAVDRDRRRPVGLVARLRRAIVRHRSQGLHGQGQLSSRSPIAGR